VPWVQPWGTAAAKAPPVYADQLIPDDEQKRAAETDEDAQAIPFLKRFTVFNTDHPNERVSQDDTALHQNSNLLETTRHPRGHHPTRSS
jgi:antirestriction protein ArdC